MLPTPVNRHKLAAFLTGYNPNIVKSLIDGFAFGFKLNYTGPRVSRMAANLKSADQLPHIMEEKIFKEVKAGRISGPHDYKPFDNFIVSPIGLVPKKEKNKYRMIHHLSFPEGESVNDYIPKEFCSVTYASIDDHWGPTSTPELMLSEKK